MEEHCGERCEEKGLLGLNEQNANTLRDGLYFERLHVNYLQKWNCSLLISISLFFLIYLQ